MGAEFRSVHTRMWREDEWFQSLDTEGRLLFIYLFTNPSASISGIYRLPLRTMAFESGLPVQRVEELLRQFSQSGKAHYEAGVVWVVRMRDNQLPGKISYQVQARLEKDIASIPDCELKKRYLIQYGYPIDTVSIPTTTGVDTVSIPITTDTDTDTDTDTETERATNVAAQALPVASPKSRSSSARRSPYHDHPAVQAYHDLHNRWPQTAQMTLIAERNPPIDTWVRALRAWAGKGYNPNNIAGILEWAENQNRLETAEAAKVVTNGKPDYNAGQWIFNPPPDYTQND